MVTFTADLGQGEELEPARKKVGCYGCSDYTVLYSLHGEGWVALVRGGGSRPQEGGLHLLHWLALLEATGVKELLCHWQPAHALASRRPPWLQPPAPPAGRIRCCRLRRRV